MQQEPVSPDARTGNLYQSKHKVEGSEDISSNKPEDRSVSPDTEHTVEGGANSADNPDSDGMDVSNDDPGGGKYIHVAKGDTSHSEVPPPEVGMIVTENFPPDNTKGEEEQDIVKDVPQVQLDLGEVSPLSCDQEHMGETGSNVQKAEASYWVRILKFWSGKPCFRIYPTQDDRPHLEKADSRESPAESQEIRAQVKTPAAHNTKIVTRDSDYDIGVGTE